MMRVKCFEPACSVIKDAYGFISLVCLQIDPFLLPCRANPSIRKVQIRRVNKYSSDVTYGLNIQATK